MQRLLKTIRHFGAHKGGSPALEFAFIAPLFFAILFGTFELGRGLHERSRLGAAAAIATRTISLDPGASSGQVKNDITAKLDHIDANKLTIKIGSTQTIAGQDFKEIDIEYDFDFLIKFGRHLDGFTLKTTRFAPVLDAPA